ncbi:MAG: alanine dehydrogenase, partial [Thermodesulfobacteriota bacterium]
MIIGVPKEVKEGEKRVAITPQGVDTLVFHRHQVLVQEGAGEGSGFSDQEYRRVGATIVPKAKDIWADADMIVKVKEPLSQEIKWMKPGQILFTYLHLAASQELTLKLIDRHVIAIGYETVQEQDGSLPLLRPMSEIAGRASILAGGVALGIGQGGK